MSSTDILIFTIALICIGIPVIVAVVLGTRPRTGTGGQAYAPGNQPAAPHLHSSRIINGRYDMQGEPFRQGGMAAIWLARTRKNGQRCIIKTPRRGTAMDHVYVDKLAMEAGFLKRLSHPGIVKYIDDFSWKDEYYLVLEYLEGEALMHVSPRFPTAEEKVIDWAYQVLDILSYVHAAGIIHRDINPKNIMLCPDGTVRLIDFGTARDLHAINNSKMPWAPFTQIANRGFDIPELFLGNASDSRSDLCGLAQTCIYLLTLKQPNDLCNELLRTSWPRTWREAGTLANHLEKLGISRRLSRCLTQAVLFAPGHRFADARAMQSALAASSGCQPAPQGVPAK